MNERRVVVTGIGVLASNGGSPEEYTAALREGRSGVREIRRFDPGWPFRQAGEVDLAEEPGLDRVSQLAVLAARRAVSDSELGPEGPWRETAVVAIGTSRGPASSLETILRDGAAGDGMIAEVPFHSIARHVARVLGISGPRFTVTMACVSSSLAIGRAFDAIRRGRADVALAGGADALTNLSFSGFSVLRAMTKTVCRPFDSRRDGMVLGEGSAILILEELQHARRREARLYAEIAGWGVAGDAHHATSPHPEGRGLARAMDLALHQSRVRHDEVDHINLHGTGTAANDPAECRAVERVFGTRATRIPVNSLKPMIGHTLGAAGALELAGSVLSMRGGFIAPTLHHDEPDERCRLDVVRTRRDQPTRTLVSTKSAFGGTNVAIVARQVHA